MEPEWVDFDNTERGGQLVITEAAAGCFLNTLADSKIGTIELNTEKIKAMFSIDDERFAFDTIFLD